MKIVWSALVAILLGTAALVMAVLELDIRLVIGVGQLGLIVAILSVGERV